MVYDSSDRNAKWPGLKTVQNFVLRWRNIAIPNSYSPKDYLISSVGWEPYDLLRAIRSNWAFAFLLLMKTDHRKQEPSGCILLVDQSLRLLPRADPGFSGSCGSNKWAV